MATPPGHVIAPGGLYSLEHAHSLDEKESAHLDSAGGLSKVKDEQRTSLLSAPAASVSKPVIGPGWVTWGSWTPETSPEVVKFSGRWTVPEPPATIREQIIFLHIGIQGTSAGKTVFAPAVLQWGKTPFGGGKYWGIACWAQIGKNIVVSNFVRVEPGDSIDATSERSVSDGKELWKVSATGGGDIATLTFTLDEPLASLQFFGAVLEAYAVNMECSEYPASSILNFTDLAIVAEQGVVSPNWRATNQVEDCGQQTEVIDPTEIDILFRSHMA